LGQPGSPQVLTASVVAQWVAVVATRVFYRLSFPTVCFTQINSPVKTCISNGRPIFLSGLGTAKLDGRSVISGASGHKSHTWQKKTPKKEKIAAGKNTSAVELKVTALNLRT